MIQDIFPKVYHNEYKKKEPSEDSVILFFDNSSVLLKNVEGLSEFPRKRELDGIELSFIYLFSIDETEFFLTEHSREAEERLICAKYGYEKTSNLRNIHPKDLGFAGITAFHLYNWYNENRFCGKCGGHMKPDDRERMLCCEHCNTMVYPRISPAVIVAIVDGERLLMTKYAGREYTRYALIAGFTEVGESIESTVMRETMEEVGLRVRNITYYKSQPWAFSGSLLMGFFAELDGEDTITLDENELSEAGWFTSEEINLEPDDISLTREMILKFKSGDFRIEKSENSNVERGKHA